MEESFWETSHCYTGGYSDDIHVSTNEIVLAVQALGANKASGAVFVSRS